MLIPEKLKKGDTVVTISPSWGCAGASRVRREYELRAHLAGLHFALWRRGLFKCRKNAIFDRVRG